MKKPIISENDSKNADAIEEAFDVLLEELLHDKDLMQNCIARAVMDASGNISEEAAQILLDYCDDRDDAPLAVLKANYQGNAKVIVEELVWRSPR